MPTHADWSHVHRETIHGRVEAAARAHPKRTAIAAAEGTSALTYGDLLERVDVLARRLRRAGVESESPVAVALERSPLLPVALLAVLQAGGAYVPLDPTHPEQRLRNAIEQSGARLVLTERKLLGRLALGIPLLAADDADAPSDGASDAVATAFGAELAYVIFTSGSTGRPKGVAVTHAAVVAVLDSVASLVDSSCDDTLLAITTVAFDIAALELFLPLTMGGTLVVAPPAAGGDGPLLHDSLDRCGATLFQATPATWRLLLDTGWRPPPGFRGLCGGEALPRPLARELGASTAAWNVYGPTETTIWSTAEALTHVGENDVVSIGRPFPGEEAHVLDDRFAAVPDGAVGELLLGGVGLARGYFGQPDLTAERFVPSPFGRQGERLYRTGDLARRLPDGRLEFLGRADHQLKVRGFRVEPAEIEDALLAVRGVRECVVVAASRGSTTDRLVAYVAGTDLPTPRVLRDALRAALPDYMIPSLFVAVPTLPRNASGKIDRAALPEPDPSQSLELDAYEEPQQGPETVIAEVWSSLLDLERVGATDNFFELGGHSLMVAQLHFRLNSAFELTLPLLELFIRPTIREQAMLVEELVLAEIEGMTDEEVSRSLGEAADRG